MSTTTSATTALPVQPRAPTASMDPRVQGWITAFRNEHPLHNHFPVHFDNGAFVGEFVGVCSACAQAVSPDMVHGRVMRSTATVVTVEGNSYCEKCECITHHECRFRAVGKTYCVEWAGTDGKWYQKSYNPPSLWKKIFL